MKNLVFQSKYLVFRLKTLDSDRNTRFFEHEILKYQIFQKSTYFERNTQYIENLEFRLNSQYRENYFVPWLFLFVANVWTVTKRRSAGLKNIVINSNSNYDVAIINYYVMMILIILRIQSILLFTLNIIFNCFSVILAAIIRILLIGMDV